MKEEQIGKERIIFVELAYCISQHMKITGQDIPNFAMNCDLNESIIKNALSQSSEITAFQLEKICDYLKIDMQELITPPQNDKNYNMMINEVHKTLFEGNCEEIETRIVELVVKTREIMSEEEARRNAAWIQYHILNSNNAKSPQKT